MVASTLSADALDDLGARILARPGAWVGQEIIEPSPTPTVAESGSIEPRPTILRTFAVADEHNSGAFGHGYNVLPGGLTRVGAGLDTLVISSRSDGTSKDTWVASEQPALQQSPWLRSARSTAPPTGGDRPLHSRFPAGWRPSCSSSVGRPNTPSWSSGSSAPCWPALTSLSGWAWTGGPNPCRSCSWRSGPSRGSTRFPSPTRRRPQVAGPVPPPAIRARPARSPTAPRPGVPGSRARRGRRAHAGGGPPHRRRALSLLLDAGVDGSLVSSLGLLVDAAYSVREQLSSDSLAAGG